MATIAIFGGTGYAGGAITDEALRRGHTVISVSRKEAEVAGTAGLIARAGNLHDPALVDHMAVEADVIVVAIRASEQDGTRLADAIPLLAKTAAEHSTRLGVVGGAGSLHVLLADADGSSNISGPDYAKAFVDEIEQPKHRRQRFTVAY
jgi:putative NADH-flavin reductase